MLIRNKYLTVRYFILQVQTIGLIDGFMYTQLSYPCFGYRIAGNKRVILRWEEGSQAGFLDTFNISMIEPKLKNIIKANSDVGKGMEKKKKGKGLGMW